MSGIGKKPRILFVLSGLGAGGAERVACNMLNFWASQQFQVGLLTLANLEDDHYSVDTRVSRLSLDIIWTSQNILVGLISNLKRMRMIRSSVVEFAPDIVISFIDRTNILVIASLLGTKLPVIVSERVDPREYSIDPVRRLARRCLYPFARALVVQTESVAAWGRSVTRSNKVEVIVNPIDVLPEPSVYANRPQVAVAVGRLAHQKGFDLLIRAFAVSRMRVAGWKLNILGEGPERPALQQLIDKHDLTNQVSLAGVVSEPWKWLDQARVFVLPSRFEGFPNALLEAMSMGCASIAADCPSGPGEIISNGENGMLVQPEDVDALVLALDSLEQNQLLAETLSDRGRMVRDRFATRKIMSEWNELIRNKLEK
ncbi:MAG: glycosyltransferase family 4 protein [Pseudomonadaceae bacterium]|nr:glycosyltransferase family 4 protein [Pseudomonadaceae bacterium]